ncbi:MAG: hypothetical protein AB7F59_10005 [Bdellovibrionales bacterium]
MKILTKCLVIGWFLLSTLASQAQQLSPAVQSFMNKMNGVELLGDGPNCWGTALALGGLTSAVRYATFDEITFWMNSPLCQKILPADASTGDILIIREGFTEKHAALVITKDLIFEKQAFNSGTPFRFRELLRVTTEDYNVAPECHGTGPLPQCKTHSLYFHCQSTGAFLEKNRQQISENFLSFKKELDDLERKISDFALDENLTEDTVITLLREQLWSLQKKNEQHLQEYMKNFSNTQKDENNLFVWESIYQRSRSLTEQLRNLKSHKSLFPPHKNH